jgi:hypothetical protein
MLITPRMHGHFGNQVMCLASRQNVECLWNSMSATTLHSSRRFAKSSEDGFPTACTQLQIKQRRCAIEQVVHRDPRSGERAPRKRSCERRCTCCASSISIVVAPDFLSQKRILYHGKLQDYINIVHMRASDKLFALHETCLGGESEETR